MVNLRRAVALAGVLSLVIGVALVASLWEGPAPEPKLISCNAMSYAERLNRDEIKHNASPNVGGMGMYHYEVTYPTPRGSPPHTAVVHPTVALWTAYGRLLGSDRGEFGGELVLADEEHPEAQPRLLYQANIEDLFLMKYGVIATTGYFHMDQDFGSILLVTFSESGKPNVREIFKLPAGVFSSWVLRNGKLLVNTSAGSFAISSPTSIEQVRCLKHWWQII